MDSRALLLLIVIIAKSAARKPSGGGPKSSSTTATNATMADDSIIVNNNDQGNSTLALISAVLGGIILTALLLHCCWCCALYCLIGWRTRTLQKQIVARREKMPRVPFIIIRKDDDCKLDAEIVLNFDRYEVADEKWFAFKKTKTSNTDRQSNRNDNTHTSDPITN